MNTKICNKCKVEKGVSDFFNQKSSKDGYSPFCKDCNKIRLIDWKNSRVVLSISSKICTKCNQSKDITNFNTDKTKDGFKGVCKDCNKISRNKYKSENLDKIKEQWKIRNKKAYLKGDKIKRRLYHRNYVKRRLKNDPSFRLLRNTRNALYRILKGNKIHNTPEYVGYTTEQIWSHLERQFRDGMTRENYGKVWHVDHIIPLQWFKDNSLMDETNIKIACHHGNLRPLLVEENYAKGDKLLNLNFIY